MLTKLRSVLLSLEQASGCCGELVQTHIAGAPGSVVLEWVRECISHQLPGEARAAGQGPTLAEPLLKSECPASVSCRSVCQAKLKFGAPGIFVRRPWFQPWMGPR